MFDIGFSEIVVIAVVALIVIGPERLPKTARTLGLLFGRLQRYVTEVKADINRELELEELRKLQSEVKSAALDIHSTMTSAAEDVASGARKLESDLNAAAGESASSPGGGSAAGNASEASAPVGSADGTAPATPDSARQASLPGFERG